MDQWIKNLISDSFHNSGDIELILKLIEVIQSGSDSSDIDRMLRKTIEGHVV